MLNKAFFSIVDHGREDQNLTVRARFKQDINRVFPTVDVEYSPQRDYAYRAYIDRETVAQAMADQVREINYHNFKNSVKENWRHDAYADVWTVMYREQEFQKRNHDREHSLL